MQDQYIEESDYCLKCGNPLLFPSKPCPKCNSINPNAGIKQNVDIKQNSSQDLPKVFTQEDLVYKKEPVYFWISVVLSALSYLVLIYLIRLHLANPIFILGLAAFIFINHGLMIGHIRGNAIKVSENQFPEVNCSP